MDIHLKQRPLLVLVANLRLISDGYIDLAIAQADLLSDAYNATGTFADKNTRRVTKRLLPFIQNAPDCCKERFWNHRY